MDGQRFDAITRGFAARATRRRTLAGALGLAAATIGVGDAAASRRVTCRPWNASCLRSSQCCDGRCETRRTAPRSQRNRCTCREGFERCAGACVDLQTDVTNCGACGNVCASDDICEDGECVCVLGTNANCASCGDVCDGSNGEICFPESGCDSACAASTDPDGYGFYTTENPPVFYDGYVLDPFRVYDPTGVNVSNVVSCTTTADCTTGCAAATAAFDHPTEKAIGCGCMKWECGTYGTGDLSGYFDFLGAAGYFCAMIRTRK